MLLKVTLKSEVLFFRSVLISFGHFRFIKAKNLLSFDRIKRLVKTTVWEVYCLTRL